MATRKCLFEGGYYFSDCQHAEGYCSDVATIRGTASIQGNTVYVVVVVLTMLGFGVSHHLMIDRF